MNSFPDDLVCDALARHLGAPVTTIRPEHRLRGHLGLDSLDIALVVLRLQRDVGREFPMALLEVVETVDELSRLVQAWASAPGKEATE